MKVCLPSTVLYRVIFAWATLLAVSFLIEGEPPLPDQLPGEHTGPPSHVRQYLFYHLSYLVQHSLTHSIMADRRIVVGHVPTDNTCSFMCTNHIDMTTHNPAFFMSWVALCEPLVCSYDVCHSRAWQASVTSLAASSIA